MVPRDIGHDGSLAAPDPTSSWVVPPDSLPRLEVGDVIATEILAADGSIRAAVATEADLPAVASDNVLVLRARAPLDPGYVRWILAFLRSSDLRAIAIGTVGLVRVKRSELVNLEIPLLDDALAAALDDLAIVRERMSDWQRAATQLLQSAFRDRNVVQARERIIASGQTLRLRVEAATQLDEFSYTIRTRFPFPIAARWREVEVRMSAGEPKEAYEAVLATAEILCGYSALIVSALAREAGIELSSVRAIREKLAGGRTGPGFGEWVAVLEEIVSGRKRRTLPAEHPLQEFGSLLAGSETVAARKRLYDQRNAVAHHRGPDQVELPAALSSAHADLFKLLGRARFLADLRLAHFTDVRWDQLLGSATVDYRSMMGDHPVVPTNTMSSSRNDLEPDSLYLIDREHGLHLLRPFLIGRPCPKCRNWSTFHVDQVPRSGAVLKSLDHSHTLPDAAVGASLSAVGLI
ncbi:putative restriction-modification system endonuclease/methyltransferase [Streptantibioticus cattleyicolor NRRL 8057 = DSM 46488]|uniref:Putative restriction-modification system endonuclease/methyltransferase n=1 Tax=Streptantibioticus cattleyicolor (strain ATCC 35852 / DSM 46488 / JCM 4925 / NBRC 14057 / NRRL 8057) TaxID=1003195 RepID=G8WZT0_STREN|nr:putative restriction-modification system endonuclease/methyltransferase [Streptantibioticus cattleyicolor NRRL 8057 = DSM 46488]